VFTVSPLSERSRRRCTRRRKTCCNARRRSSEVRAEHSGWPGRRRSRTARLRRNEPQVALGLQFLVARSLAALSRGSGCAVGGFGYVQSRDTSLILRHTASVVTHRRRLLRRTRTEWCAVVWGVADSALLSWLPGHGGAPFGAPFLLSSLSSGSASVNLIVATSRVARLTAEFYRHKYIGWNRRTQRTGAELPVVDFGSAIAAVTEAAGHDSAPPGAAGDASRARRHGKMSGPARSKIRWNRL